MSTMPSGWASVTVGELIELNPKTEAADATTAGFVPMHALGTDFRSKLGFEPRPWGDIKKAYTHFADGDVLLAKITPCFENGKAGLVQGLPSGIGAGSSEFFVCRPKPNAVDARYLLAWVSGDDFRARATVQMTGSVGHKRVPKDFLLAEVLPVAPYREQQRIADKLDTVLTRVAACRDRLARVAPLLKRFRQSVLAAATSGRLTEDWRTTNATGDAAAELSDWLAIRSSRERKAPIEPNLKHWRSEVPQGWIVASPHQFAECLDRQRVPIKREDRKSAKGLYPYYGANGEVGRIDEYIFDDDLVLVTEDETFYGREKPIAYRASGRCWVNNHAHVLRARTRAANDYLCFALMHYDVLPWLTGTTGRAKLTQQAMNALPIAIPPNAELEEVVRRVETLFAFADRLEARLAQVQTAVDRLTPSLLAKAFRGELVPQDPADEPAAKLLKRLAVQRDAVLAKKASPTKMAAQAKKAAPAKKAARQKPGTNGPRHIAPVVEMLVPDNQPPTAKREPAPSSVGSQPLPDGEAVDAAVFCPPEVPRASRFMVQVYLYPPARSSEATALAKEADAGAERRGVLSLLLDLPRGTRVDLHLEMPTLKVEEADAQLIWRGATTGAQFEVEVPAGAADGTAIGRMRFSIAGVPAGTLRFQTSVASAVTTATSRQAEIWVKRYRRAFVSYSSEDRAEVLRRVQAFKIAGMSVFQDILDLGPGERWAKELYREIDGCDVFLLFWSKAAAESPWVGKEIDYAIAHQKGDPEHPPEIQPVPIEGPPIPDRPASLQHLHFNDALLAHIAVA